MMDNPYEPNGKTSTRGKTDSGGNSNTRRVVLLITHLFGILLVIVCILNLAALYDYWFKEKDYDDYQVHVAVIWLFILTLPIEVLIVVLYLLNPRIFGNSGAKVLLALELFAVPFSLVVSVAIQLVE